MITERFNTDWLFWEEKNAFALVWNVPDNAELISLPHDAMRSVPAYAESVNGGNTGYRDGGSYVYVKRFFAPEELQGQTVILRFDGVYMNSLVYVNSQKVGGRPCGYSRFEVPIHDRLRYGEENEIRVLVKNIGPNSRWYSGSGIYRDVYLLSSGPVYIPDGELKAATVSINEEYTALSVDCRIVNRGAAAKDLKLELSVYDPNGNTVAEKSVKITLNSASEETIKTALTVSEPLLWSAEAPNLYRCEAKLTSEERVLDSSETHFGIRSLALDSRRGFQVNGKTVKLRGACIHHDNGLMGAESHWDAELRRVRGLKAAGFNAIRMAHHPMSEALLYACDRVGMYVMDETFDMWTRPKGDNDYALHFERWWRDDVADMVKKDYNHPCVVFYSLGNEIPEISTPAGAALGREMSSFIKALDPTRYALASINGVFAAGDSIGLIMAELAADAPEEDGSVNDFLSLLDTRMDDILRHRAITDALENAPEMDLIGYNYMTARYEQDGIAYPHRVIVGSETYPCAIAENWKLVKKLPHVVGDFVWTGWDYIGEAGIGIPGYAPGEGGLGAQYPCQLAYCGDIDITGFRRPASYYREIVYGLRTQPYIAVEHPDNYGKKMMPSQWIMSDVTACWSYPGSEGKPTVVEVYAPGDEVELFLDGESLGIAPSGEAGGFAARFTVDYKPGKLEAVCYEKGSELGRAELETSGATSSVELSAESADPLGFNELVFINISCRDEKGLVTDESIGISAELSGCELVGFGSANPRPAGGYLSDETETFHGRALLIVRKTQSKAAVKVTDAKGRSSTCEV